jgi:hypothetical protein
VPLFAGDEITEGNAFVSPVGTVVRYSWNLLVNVLISCLSIYAASLCTEGYSVCCENKAGGIALRDASEHQNPIDTPKNKQSAIYCMCHF